jgi:tetratricopeptide (TPR) repeat protein
LGFVCRERELARLSEELAAASAGRTRVVVVEGQAGAGKSALVSRFVERHCAGLDVRARSFRGSALKGPMSELASLAAELGAGEPPTEWTRLDEVFLLSKDGLLIHHGGIGSAVDEDVLGSMLSAVQDFVRDSFGDRDSSGGLNELAYKGLQILIEHGQNIFAACVVSRGTHPSMRAEIRRAVSLIESKYGQRLAPWDGDVESLPEVPDIVASLAGARFPKLGLSAEEASAQQNLRFEWLRAALDSEHGECRVIVLDDVQEADRTSAKGLAYALRGLGDRKMLVMLVTRSDGGTVGPEISGLLDDGHAERLAVGPLDASGTKELLGQTLKGAVISDSLVADIHDATRGIPSETIALSSLLLKEGRIVSEGGIWAIRGRRAGWWNTMSEAASKMLEDLDPDTLSMLEMCATLSTRSNRDMLSRGLDWSAAKLDGRLRHAVELGLLAEREGGLTLRSAQIESALAEGMGGLRRAMWHRTAARVLLAEKWTRAKRPVFAIAEHLALGHVAEPGVDLCIEAAELAEMAYAYPEAAKYLDWAADLMERGGGDARMADVLSRLAGVLHTDGDFAAEAKVLERLMAAGLDAAGRADAARRLGLAHYSQGDLAKAERLYAEALAALEGTGRALEMGRIKKEMARLALKDSPQEALRLDGEYLAAAEAAKSPRDAGLACLAIGADKFHMKLLDDAVSHWLRAAETFSSAGDDFGLSDALVNLGAAYNVRSDAASSISSLERAVDIKERIGDYKRLAAALNNLGIAYQRAGDTERAIGTHRRCLEMRIRIGDGLGMAKSHNSLGVLYGSLGRHVEAVESFTRALNMLLRRGDSSGAAMSHANIAETYLAMGKLTEAERHAALSYTIASEKKNVEAQIAALSMRGQILSRKGQWPSAGQEFDKALQLSMAFGEPRRLGLTYLECGEEGARHGDARARGMLELARDTFGKAGAKPLADRAQAALESMK